MVGRAEFAPSLVAELCCSPQGDERIRLQPQVSCRVSASGTHTRSEKAVEL